MDLITAHRGKIAHCTGDPAGRGDHFECFVDGLLLLDNGHVVSAGPAEPALQNLTPEVDITEHGEHLLVPGFVDAHIHFPQIDVIASYGTQLLEWLENYTFPAEAAFADAAHAQLNAEFFLDELLRNGTTSALVFATVHPQSVDALFTSAAARSMRIAAGKVLMDRHCPENLRDNPETGYADSRALLEKWHGQDRLLYAITPRFAITSTDEQLRLAGKLAGEFPDALIHTHLAENPDEVRWVQELFPASSSYLDVYHQHGLLRERSVFAHCLHLHDDDYQRMATNGGGMAFCPTSNLFLGSGLFDLQRARAAHIPVGLGTDVGGGTSFSMLQTANEAYKVLQLGGQTLSSVDALYLATLGAAETLGIDTKVGSFEPGKEADFVVLDAHATPLIQRRLARSQSIEDSLFVHMMLGDDRSVKETYILGAQAYAKPQSVAS